MARMGQVERQPKSRHELLEVAQYDELQGAGRDLQQVRAYCRGTDTKRLEQKDRS